MTENFKILAEFIKDISSETPNIESYIYVKENISKYQLNIDINSKPLKNKMIEVNTTLKFEDKEANEKKSYFEIIYASVIKIDEEIKDKKDLEKTFLNLLHNSGFPEVKLEKKIDFTELYKKRSN